MNEPTDEKSKSKAICLADISGIQVGHSTEADALTGCTAVVFPRGAVAGHVAWGTATGTRELDALTPRHMVERIHAICLCGGSAYGLAAASGVARKLEAEDIGHSTSAGKVPIVAGAVVYDLNLGDSSVRPDEGMGERAAHQALNDSSRASGNIGAGTGVSAGKLLAVSCATKTGLGNGGVATEEGLQVAALVVLNPVGDVLDPRTGGILAGAREAPGSRKLADTAEVIRAGAQCAPLNQHNTTLCVVGTNAALTRVEARWVAEQSLVALARLIDPPFTLHDGDVVFCVSTGNHEAELHRVGLLARDAAAAAIVDACLSAEPAGDLPSCRTLGRRKEPSRQTATLRFKIPRSADGTVRRRTATKPKLRPDDDS
jgi:L-aminopeptidase/D-esterase-like protein